VHQSSWDGRDGGVAGFLGMEPRSNEADMGGMGFAEERLVHFKFEPMILHVLTSSLHHAQLILSAALQAGFRESGALNLTATTTESPTPMVAIRSMGLGLESVIGQLNADGQGVCIVPERYLKGLLAVANDRFAENTKRIERFRELLAKGAQKEGAGQTRRNKEGGEWEDAAARRERMRKEGLERSQKMRGERLQQNG